MDTQFFLINIFFYLTWVRVDLVDQGAMVMKGYSTFPKPPKLEPHHQLEFNVIPRTCRPSVTAF